MIGMYGTALQAASVNGYELIVRILLEAGARVDTIGGYYGTALQGAKEEDRNSIMDLLRANGAHLLGRQYGTAERRESLREMYGDENAWLE